VHATIAGLLYLFLRYVAVIDQYAFADYIRAAAPHPKIGEARRPRFRRLDREPRADALCSSRRILKIPVAVSVQSQRLHRQPAD
jgi:hypothetical protein